MAEKLEILAKVLISGLIIGIGIVLLGVVWFFMDLIQPEGKFSAFLSGSVGVQILVVASALLAILFLVIIFSTVWKKGYDYILDKLES